MLTGGTDDVWIELLQYFIHQLKDMFDLTPEMARVNAGIQEGTGIQPKSEKSDKKIKSE